MRTFRMAAVLLLSAPLSACIESELSIELRKDGTGTKTWAMKSQPRTTEVLKDCLRECREACEDPGGFVIPAGVLEPDERDREAAARAGLNLKEWKSGLPDELWCRGRAEFERLSSLDAIRHLKAGKKLFALRRVEKDLYEMSCRNDTKASPTSSESVLLGLARDERYSDPISRAMKALEKDLIRMRTTMVFKVPGEVLDCDSPGEVEKLSPDSVRLDLGMAAIRAKAARLEAEGKRRRWRSGDPDFTLRFRMPEGEAIPEAALTPEPTAEAR